MRARTDDGGEPAALAAAGARGLLPAPGAADHRLGPVPDAAPCPLVPVEFPASPARGGRSGLAASAEGGGGSHPGGAAEDAACGQPGAARIVEIEQAADELSGGEKAGHRRDRKSVVSGKRVSVRVALGGRRIIKKKNK